MKGKQVIPLEAPRHSVRSTGPEVSPVPRSYQGTQYAPRDPRGDSRDGAEFEPTDGAAMKLHHRLAGAR